MSFFGGRLRALMSAVLVLHRTQLQKKYYIHTARPTLSALRSIPQNILRTNFPISVVADPHLGLVAY